MFFLVMASLVGVQSYADTLSVEINMKQRFVVNSSNPSRFDFERGNLIIHEVTTVGGDVAMDTLITEGLYTPQNYIILGHEAITRFIDGNESTVSAVFSEVGNMFEYTELSNSYLVERSGRGKMKIKNASTRCEIRSGSILDCELKIIFTQQVK